MYVLFVVLVYKHGMESGSSTRLLSYIIDLKEVTTLNRRRHTSHVIGKAQHKVP